MSRTAPAPLSSVVVFAFIAMIGIFGAAGSQGQQQSHRSAHAAGKASGTPDTTITSLKKRLAAAPSNAGLREALALAYQNGGQMEAAIAEYHSLRKAFPDNPEYMYRLGQAYLAAARMYAERLNSRAPHSARLLQLQGEKLANEGLIEPAELAYREAIHVAPRLPGLHLALGRLYAQRGDTQSAIAAADRELAIDPDSEQARSFRASLDAGPGTPPAP